MSSREARATRQARAARDPREAPAGTGPHHEERAVAPLLDVAFGFFVWMAHLLTIYIATALTCGFGLVARGGRTPLLLGLALVTLLAAAIVIGHALRRWRQQRHAPDRRFRMTLTLGGDALATLAIAWQLLAVSIVPLCA